MITPWLRSPLYQSVASAFLYITNGQICHPSDKHLEKAWNSFSMTSHEKAGAAVIKRSIELCNHTIVVKTLTCLTLTFQRLANDDDDVVFYIYVFNCILFTYYIFQ